jgi:hypothetical protein
MNLWVLWTVQWLSAAQGLHSMELYSSLWGWLCCQSIDAVRRCACGTVAVASDGPVSPPDDVWVGREHCWSNKSYGTGELSSKTCVIFTFPTTNPTYTVLNLNPDLCSEKPANMGLANDKTKSMSYSLYFEWRRLQKVYVLLVVTTPLLTDVPL